ncbi:MAG: hypothetical protein AAFR61_04785 [Bacteroidota bacterium]
MQSYTWFYSLKETLSPEVESQLEQDFDHFLAQWKSHGTPVDGLIQISYHRFVIIQSDPQTSRPSGCSIDSLKRAVGQILQQRHQEVLDAAHVFYRDEQQEIAFTHFRDIPKLVAAGSLSAETQVFDHSLGQSDDLSRWEIALQDSWLKRFLPSATNV